MDLKYISTRNKNVCVCSAQAIAQGISQEGGLFVPAYMPQISLEEIEEMSHMNYRERACRVLGRFLTDFTAEELRQCVDDAYGEESDPNGKFGGGPAPLSKLCPDMYMMELWHGPTCAFKDMALQLLPRLMTVAAGKVLDGQQIAILVATSGDTGKAALEGFKDVPGTKMLVFYPQNGVSAMQKLQMATQEGDNLSVCAIEGNFDDAQTGVKKIFTNPEIRQKLAEHGIVFSSANSINWGRLVPQIVYYFSAYCDLLANEEIYLGEKVNVTVPTGNFGNILAAYYAREMGLPLGKLICASNRNNVLTDFIQTGSYDKNRPFYLTQSPSMDILVSSNPGRLVCALCHQADRPVSHLMRCLAEDGRYTIAVDMKTQLQQIFAAQWCDEQQTDQEIQRMYREYSYLCDTHTAVAAYACRRYREETGDMTKNIVVSTASPYKFPGSVLSAVTGKSWEGETAEDAFAQAQQLSELTHTPQPQSLLELRTKPVLHRTVCTKDTMEQELLRALGL